MEIFHNQRNASYVWFFSTADPVYVLEHMPEAHRRYLNYNEEMAGAFEDQCRIGGLQGLSFEDRFGILVDREWESRRNNRLVRLIRSAGFRYQGACMEDIVYHADRKLDRGKLLPCQAAVTSVTAAISSSWGHPAAGKHIFPMPWVLLRAGTVLPSGMSGSRTC